MIFFTAIEKMDRENMLDLLIFLEGPGVYFVHDRKS